MSKETRKYIYWYNIAFMAFTSVFNFTNLINAFSAFKGIAVVIPWAAVLVLYFLPYVLIAGELGATFPKEKGGVAAWIMKTIGPGAAFFAGWIYFVVHMPYLVQKPSQCIVALGWVFTGNNVVSSFSPTIMQICVLLVFLTAVFIALRGFKLLSRITSLAGMALFVMCILFILLMLAAPFITQNPVLINNLKSSELTPTIDVGFFTSFGLLLFGVGGCERITPYISKLKNPGKDFPKGMIALFIGIALIVLLGTVSLGMIFNSNHIPADFLTNGVFYAFRAAGEFYGLGDVLMIAFAIATVIATFGVIVLSIDAPLRMLLDGSSTKYIPRFFYKQNKNGAYSNAILCITVVVSILIIIPMLGIGSVDNIVSWLVRINGFFMPLRYCFVFIAYIALKCKVEQFPNSDYVFIKSKKLGIIVGAWCLAINVCACILGMFSGSAFEITLNILIPVVLIGIGFLLPLKARKENRNKSLKA